MGYKVLYLSVQYLTWSKERDPEVASAVTVQVMDISHLSMSAQT